MKKTPKTNQKKPKPKAKIENGVVILVPPEDEEEELEEKEVQPKSENTQDAVVTQTGAAQPHHVVDKKSEEKAHSLAAEIREENKKNAEKVHIKLKAKKELGSVVIDGTSKVPTQDENLDFGLDSDPTEKSKKTLTKVKKEMEQKKLEDAAKEEHDQLEKQLQQAYGDTDTKDLL